YGCGYSFYRRESELRADDLLIRGKLCKLLQESRVHLSSLEVQDAAATAAGVLRAQQALEAMETAISSGAVPEMGRIHQHHREARGALERLVALDGEVLLALVTLRDAVARLGDGPAAAAAMANLLGASDFGVLWRRREALLSGESE
ncbi:MAG: hypothetical protein KGJ72_14755, partial [Gammaproteobacteria bacterium]|nr:hypothetical protein [Gammaproteobacteria bacterium]